MLNFLPSFLKKITGKQQMLDPRSTNPNPEFHDVKNTRMPDGSTTNPSTKTGYIWSSKYVKGAADLSQPTHIPNGIKNVVTPKPMVNVVTNPPEATPTKREMKVYGDFYDAAEKIGEAYGIPKEYFLANSRWEHRNDSNWSEGKFKSNIWWDDARKRGEASYGPYQINMKVFGPDAVKAGRITPQHPQYMTPQDAEDVWKATEWQAKKWKSEMKKYEKNGQPVDWEQIFQQHNPGELNRGKNVQNLINTLMFLKEING